LFPAARYEALDDKGCYTGRSKAMTKLTHPRDFRAKRTLLPDSAFALVEGPRAEPSDPVDQATWAGIIHLPDHVALTTSDHHGSELARLYTLWGDWITAVGDDHDPLFAGMLDAVDCLQGSVFDALHGYYRSAIADLRTALELVAIGTLGNLSPSDPDYLRWSVLPHPAMFPSVTGEPGPS
jgi:hypothetical protein